MKVADVRGGGVAELEAAAPLPVLDDRLHRGVYPMDSDGMIT